MSVNLTIVADSKDGIATSNKKTYNEPNCPTFHYKIKPTQLLDSYAHINIYVSFLPLLPSNHSHYNPAPIILILNLDVHCKQNHCFHVTIKFCYFMLG